MELNLASKNIVKSGAKSAAPVRKSTAGNTTAGRTAAGSNKLTKTTTGSGNAPMRGKNLPSKTARAPASRRSHTNSDDC